MPKLSYADIARIEERRLAVGTAAVVACAEPIAGGWMAFDGDGSWGNFAVGLGLDGPVTGEDLDRLVAFYAARGAEPRIEVCPFAHGSLVRGLADRGFVLREFENVLAREIAPDEDLRALMPRGGLEGLEIVRIDPGDDAQVRMFIEIATSGFRPADAPLSPALFEITRRLVAHPGCDSYLALVNGEPAGGGSVEVSGEGAALFGASVLSRFRQRGIQQALIVRRLERAREQGRHLACISASPGIPTERNAMRLGFFMAYSKGIFTRRSDGRDSGAPRCAGKDRCSEGP
ncbi:GNAT family N-acetyltransferase [Sorangium sp. So ce1000]|uniref:GNAT family N-acetyltransferase n=1 Tax=Sorangium sp. So ce1000 TaxID=3133325 RepID=UPI003F5D5FF3